MRPVRGTTSAVLALLLFASAAAQSQTTTGTRRTTRQATTASYTIPAGTELQVRVNEDLSSEKNQPGDSFTGVLHSPVVVNGRTVFDRGADVVGRVTTSEPSGRLSDPGVLELTITSVGTGPNRQVVQTEPFVIKGADHTKGNVYKIGGGAALGAIIGGIAGGGKGAAIGAAVGAGAGTAGAAATGKKPARVESEAILTWRTSVASNTASSTESSTTSEGLRRRTPTSTTGSTGTSGTAASSTHTGSTTGTTSGATGTAVQDEPADAYTDAEARTFADADRRAIRDCMERNRADLPPSLTRRMAFTAAQERSLRAGGVVPRELQRRLQFLPRACERELPRLPREIERVVLGRRVLLIDDRHTILDVFDLDNY